MTPQDADVKRVSLRWSGPFWEAVVIEAAKRRTSVQSLVTNIVAEKLGIVVPGETEESSAA